MAERERKKKEAEQEEKKKKKPKRDFETGELRVITSEGDVLENLIKPGHWVSATQLMRSNNFDFSANLESATVDRAGEPIELEHAPFGLRMSRPASLPKGQAKSLEMYYYIPRRVGATSQAPWLEMKLRARTGGADAAIAMKPTVAMPNYQYHLMVLASDPDRYGYLKAPYMSSIRAPSDTMDEDSLLFYRVVLPKIDNIAPLPSHPLVWTSIAYLIWDDLDATSLTPDQQQAMLDWLHWGGQLVISGPSSLNRLRRSFLADYLPADEIRAVDLTADDLKALNENFTLPVKTPKEESKTLLEAPAGKAIVGVELELHSDAHWLPKTGRMVAERQIGRGRIVVTAFPLADRNLVNWPSFDNFFNACILRRPPREYFKGSNELLAIQWSDYPGLVRDPRLVTSVRYFSRDIDYLSQQEAQQNIQREQTLEREYAAASGGVAAIGMGGPWPAPSYPETSYFTGVHPPNGDHHFGGFLGRVQSGVAGWSDFSGAAHLARSSLQEAAGIEVPDSSFVLKVMAVYLLVLVPLNWGFFRALGRVEWAWVAAPIVAIVGAVAVVRMAQLDIGFARSRTEIGILETQGGYHRGHLTRYTALYTSLSSNYTLSFDDPSALAAPFTVDPAYTRLRHQSVTTVYFDRGQQEIRLRGFPVQSNSTNMVHSEQMYNVGDGIKLVGDDPSLTKVYNGSELALRGVGVFRRLADGKVEAAWIGELPPKTSKTLNFRPTGDRPRRFEQWADSLATAPQAAAGEVSLAKLIDLSIERLQLRQGDVRLVGWTDVECQGLTIRPQASQEVFRTLILSHLRHGPLEAPRSDANHRKDIAAIDGRESLSDADLMEAEGVDPAKVLEP